MSGSRLLDAKASCQLREPKAWLWPPARESARLESIVQIFASSVWSVLPIFDYSLISPLSPFLPPLPAVPPLPQCSTSASRSRRLPPRILPGASADAAHVLTRKTWGDSLVTDPRDKFSPPCRRESSALPSPLFKYFTFEVLLREVVVGVGVEEELLDLLVQMEMVPAKVARPNTLSICCFE